MTTSDLRTENTGKAKNNLAGKNMISYWIDNEFSITTIVFS